jgi:hypothetical protein
MSRYTKEQGDLEIAYGCDHATGYFFQVYDLPLDNGEDNLIIDECSLFTRMSRSRMVELMTEYQVDPEHIDRVLMDLTF